MRCRTCTRTATHWDWFRRERALRVHWTVPTCSRVCLEIWKERRMVDPNEHELAAMRRAGDAAGEFIDALGRTDMATWSPAEWSEVTGVSYARHEKPGKPASLRVTYSCGFSQHSEWVCFEHTGYPREKACAWWQRRAADRPVPRSVAEAMAAAQALAAPSAIRLRPVGQYTEIVGVRFG